MKSIIIVSFAFGMFVAPLSAAPVSGEAVYRQRCASCHDSGNTRVPPREELKKFSVGRILRTLDFGLMNNIGTRLTQEEREAVAAYLGVAGGNGQPSAVAYCADRTVKLTVGGKTQWNGWSPASTNTRYQTGEAGGLTLDQLPRLKLKWAYGFDGDIMAFSQPTILDGNLFVGSASGLVQALSAQSGCVKWTFQADGPVRTAPLTTALGDKHALLFGD